MSLLTLIFAAALSSTPPSFGDTYQKCVDRTSTNTEWASCGEAYLKHLDDALNVAWKTAYASLDRPSRTQFLKKQRAWVRFKDASCGFYANGSSGREGQVLHFYVCRGAILEARISDLRGLYILPDPPPELAMVNTACPEAESEGVEACAYELVRQIDERLRARLCSEQPTTCAVLFANFESSRDSLTQAYLASLGEDSVVARVDTALFALALTSSFERRLLENG